MTKKAKAQTSSLLDKLSLEEKASFCSGKDFWHLFSVPRLSIPEIMITDGPHGLRKKSSSQSLGILQGVPATCFPSATTIANSWDTQLLQSMGKALALECLTEKVSVILGPGINIKRSPLCGRNFEYYSEDPFLSGEMASNLILGIQSKGVGACVKHFAVNNQETRRMTISAIVDERALFEIYLSAFEKVIKTGKPWMIMNSYNKINGVYASENKKTQVEILREKWGFEGVVVSDWGAVNERALGLACGNDLEMPSSFGYGTSKILKAISSGKLDKSVLDSSVSRILKLIEKSSLVLDKKFSFNRDEHHALARKIASESFVLLKNESILPLSKTQKIAVVGDMASKPRIQGSGSSLVNPTKVDSFIDIIKSKNISLFDVKVAEVVLVFVGVPIESEGGDRASMSLPDDQNQLIKDTYSKNKNIVVILTGGSPVEMPWINQVKGLLNIYLPGQAAGGAIFDVLYGIINPSGKLAESLPFSLDDCSASSNFPGNESTVEYRESIFVGYRYYEKVKKAVCFPFGFGLSYTTFKYSNLVVGKKKISPKESLNISFKVKNTGSCAGAEISQVYVSDKESSVFRPLKELKGFSKVFLQPNEEKTISILLDSRSFAFWNPSIHDWYVESGEFDIHVGSSSRDIHLVSTITIVNDVKPPFPKSPAVYLNGDPKKASSSDFESILGFPLPPANRPAGKKITLEDTFEIASSTKYGSKIFELINKKLSSGEADQSDIMMSSIMLQTPFRSLVCMSGGIFSDDVANNLLGTLNNEKGESESLRVVDSIPKLISDIKSFLHDNM
jgi:beta-glucosidase